MFLIYSKVSKSHFIVLETTDFCDVEYSSLHPCNVYKVEPCGLTNLGPNVGSWKIVASSGDKIFACFKSGIKSLKVDKI